MTAAIISLLTVAGIVIVKVLTWYYSDDARQKRDKQQRAKAHAANAAKDGRKLGQWFKDRWR